MSVFSISELPVGATVHMVGIGGISMSALASMLLHFGYKVTGSDRKKSDLTDELEAKGVKISTDQSAGDIGHPNLVCYTAAIAADNPELVTAHNAGIPTIERAELLGALMELYKYPIAVAGTERRQQRRCLRLCFWRRILTRLYLSAASFLKSAEITASVKKTIFRLKRANTLKVFCTLNRICQLLQMSKKITSIISVVLNILYHLFRNLQDLHHLLAA